MSDSRQVPDQPLVRVVRGTPTAPELAALVVVLAARGAQRSEPAARRPSRWADPAHRLRQPPHPAVRRAAGR